MKEINIPPATAIGSLPINDDQQALKLVFKHLPGFPHWPQQPRLGPKAGMIDQFVHPLLKMGLIKDRGHNSYYFPTEAPEWEERMLSFFNLYLSLEEGEEEVLENFSLPEQYFPGFYSFMEEMKARAPDKAQVVKGQVTGPLAVGIQLKDEQGRDAYYHPQLREVIVKTVCLQARWQAFRLSELGLPVLINIDDPGISTFGSSTYITISREDIQSSLQEVIDHLHQQQALAGLHSCAGADWSIPLELNLDLLSFDAYGYFNSLIGYPEEINQFLKEGGYLAWGIVPSSQEAMDFSSQQLFELLLERMEILVSKGVDEDRLWQQMVITPSCGAGTLPEETAARIYGLTAELREIFIDKRASRGGREQGCQPI